MAGVVRHANDRLIGNRNVLTGEVEIDLDGKTVIARLVFVVEPRLGIAIASGRIG